MAEEQIVQTPPQEPPKKQLWKGLKERGLYSKGYEDFEKKYSSPDSIKILFDGMKQRSLYSKTFEDFNGKYFSDKKPAVSYTQKNTPAAPAPTEQPQTAAPLPVQPSAPPMDVNAAMLPGAVPQLTMEQYQTMAPAPTDMERIDKRGAEGTERLVKELTNSERAVGSIVARKKQEAFTKQMQGLAASSDPMAQTYATELRAREMASWFDNRDEDEYKADLLNNPDKVREVLHEVKTYQPEKKAQIEQDMFLNNVQEIITPQNAKKVEETLAKIEKGEYEYDVKSGQLQVPLGTIDAMAKGWGERRKELQTFENYRQKKGAEGDAYLMQVLDEERNAADPLEPVPTAKGWKAQGAQMIGSDGIGLAKGVVPIVAGAALKVPQLGMGVAAALNAEENSKRTFISSFRQTYNELLDKGVDKQEAFARGKTQAIVDAAKAATQAVVSTYVGAKTGIPTKNIAWSPGYKNLMGNLLKESKQLVKATASNSLPVAGVTGATEVASNIIAKESGLNRNIADNVIESVAAELLLETGIGVLTSGARIAGKAAKNLRPREVKLVVQNIAKQSDADIAKAIANVATEQNLSPEQVQTLTETIEVQRQKESRIPPEVTNEDTRVLIHEKLDEYEAIQLKLKGGKDGAGKVSDAFKGELKQRADDLEFDVQVLKLPPKEQAKMLLDKMNDLEGEIYKIESKEGAKPTVEEKQLIKKNKTRIKELEKQQGKVLAKMPKRANANATVIGSYTGAVKQEYTSTHRGITGLFEFNKKPAFDNYMKDAQPGDQMHGRTTDDGEVGLTYKGDGTFIKETYNADGSIEAVDISTEEARLLVDEDYLYVTEAEKAEAPAAPVAPVIATVKPDENIPPANTEFVSKQNSASVIMPGQRTAPETTTIAPKESTTAVIRPIGNRSPEIIPLKSSTEAPATADLTEGSTIAWDVFGNENSSQWTVGKRTKTRGGEDAVELSQERFDKQSGLWHTETQIVPVKDLKPSKNAIQEQSAAKMDVRQSSDNGGKVGEGNKLQEVAPKNTTEKELLGDEADLSQQPQGSPQQRQVEEQFVGEVRAKAKQAKAKLTAEFIPDKEFVNAKNPRELRGVQKNLQKKFKILKQLIDC